MGSRIVFRSQFWMVVLTLACPGQSYAVELIQNSRTNVIIRFGIEEMTTTKVEEDDEKKLTLRIPGFANLAKRDGRPALPFQSRLIAVPEGTKPVVKILEQETRRVDLRRPLSNFKEVYSHCLDEELRLPNPKLPKWSLPKNPLTIKSLGYFGPVPSYLVTFSPIKQLDKRGQLEVTNNLVVDIRFERDPDYSGSTAPLPSQSLSEHKREIYESIVFNSAALPRFARSEKHNRLLYLTHSELKSSLHDYLIWQSQRGFTTTTIEVDSLSPKDIKRIIAREYASTNPPAHTILVGNSDQVPMMRSGRDHSDSYYTLLDKGPLPDLSIGRINAGTPEELDSWLTNIKKATEIKVPRQSTLLLSGFEYDFSGKNMTYLRDEIFSHSIKKTELQKMSAAMGHRNRATQKAINQNPNLIVYDGRGDHTGFTEIPWRTNHLSKLANKAKPILISSACHQPMSNANDFTTKLMTHPYGFGGILAADGPADGQVLIRKLLAAGFYDKDHPARAFRTLFRTGDLIQVAKAAAIVHYAGHPYYQQDAHRFVYLGDPSTKLLKEVD